jgi:hypothetical protein
MFKAAYSTANYYSAAQVERNSKVERELNSKFDAFWSEQGGNIVLDLWKEKWGEFMGGEDTEANVSDSDIILDLEGLSMKEPNAAAAEGDGCFKQSDEDLGSAGDAAAPKVRIKPPTEDLHSWLGVAAQCEGSGGSCSVPSVQASSSSLRADSPVGHFRLPSGSGGGDSVRSNSPLSSSGLRGWGDAPADVGQWGGVTAGTQAAQAPNVTQEAIAIGQWGGGTKEEKDGSGSASAQAAGKAFSILMHRFS